MVKPFEKLLLCPKEWSILLCNIKILESRLGLFFLAMKFSSILFFACIFCAKLTAQDCAKAWMYWEQRTALSEQTWSTYQLKVPIDKIQIDFLGAPVGVPFYYAHKNYAPYNDLVVVDGDSSKILHQKAYQSLIKMRVASGFSLPLSHCYRSYAHQRSLYQRLGPKVAEKPGFSEHHLHTAIDIKGVSNRIFRWMLLQAFDFGWVPSYYFRVDNRIQKEAWHWRYVGPLAAQKFKCAWRNEIQEKLKKMKRD